MRKTLKDFYYGNLRPCEQRMAANSELRRAVDVVTQCEKQLAEKLGNADQKLLSDMTNAQQTWTASSHWRILF